MEDNMAQQEIPFWLVWNPKGCGQPKHRHSTHESAIAEARRLALLNPGEDFYVLMPTCQVTKSDVTIRRYFDDGIPF